MICNSTAYQLSARFPGEWNERYTRYYARKYARMLTAEELHDSIALATDRPGTFGGGRRRPVMNDEEPAGPGVTMAMQVAVPNASGELKSFMQAFGQSNRGTMPRTELLAQFWINGQRKKAGGCGHSIFLDDHGAEVTESSMSLTSSTCKPESAAR